MIKVMTSPLASLFIAVIGTQFFQSFVTIALGIEGLTEIYIGIVHSAGYLGLLVASLYAERIIKRVGHIRNFCLASSIVAVTIIAQAFYVNFYLWTVCRFISGATMASVIVTIESWLISESSVENRGKTLSIYMITYYCSQAIGPQMFHFIDTNNITPYLAAAMLAILANIPVTLTYKTNPTIPETPDLEISEVYKINPYGFLGCFVSGLILSSLYSFLPKYIYNQEFSIPWMMSSLICGGFILQWPFGKISDAFNREKILCFLSVATVLPAMAIILYPSSVYTYLFMFIMGGLSFALYPISIAAVCDFIENRCIIKTTGVLLFSYALGSVSGPILVSIAIDVANTFIAMFYFIIFVSLSYGSLGIYYFFGRKISAPEEDLTVDFIPVLKNSQIGIQLDPRQDLSEQEGDLREAIEDEGVIEAPIETGLNDLQSDKTT